MVLPTQMSLSNCFLVTMVIFLVIIKTQPSKVGRATTVSYLQERTILIERSRKPAIIQQPTVKIA